MRHVRLRQAWQHWPKGHVFTAMPAAQAQVMVGAGQAEYVTEDLPAPVGRMMRSPVTAEPARRRRARDPSLV